MECVKFLKIQNNKKLILEMNDNNIKPAENYRLLFKISTPPPPEQDGNYHQNDSFLIN